MVPADCVVACHLLAAASGRALEGQKSSVSEWPLGGGFKGRELQPRLNSLEFGTLCCGLGVCCCYFVACGCRSALIRQRSQ